MTRNIAISLILLILCCRHLPQILRDVRGNPHSVLRAARYPIRAYHTLLSWLVIWSACIFQVWTKHLRPDSLTAFGFVLLILGAVLGLTAVLRLGTFYNAELVVYEGQPLIQDGIYSVVRHPLRLGLTLETLGAVMLAHTWALFPAWLLLVVMLLNRTKSEERLLLEFYGTQAQTYQRKVPAFNAFAGLLRVWTAGRSCKHT